MKKGRQCSGIRAADANSKERGFTRSDVRLLAQKDGITFNSAYHRLYCGKPNADPLLSARSVAGVKKQRADIHAAALAVDARKAEIAARLREEEE